MIQDLRADSANFERSGDRGTPCSDGIGFGPNPSPNLSIGRYEDSMIHRSRQHWGPTAPVEPPRESQPSRAESTSTSYSQGTSSSHQSAPYSSYSSHTGQPASAYGSGGSTNTSPNNYTHQPYPQEPAARTSTQSYTYPPETQHRTAQSYNQQANVPRSSQHHGYTGAQTNSAQSYNSSRYFGSHHLDYLVYH
jgi:hypothetical protein